MVPELSRAEILDMFLSAVGPKQVSDTERDDSRTTYLRGTHADLAGAANKAGDSGTGTR
jgi:hypothetical protein